MLYLLIFTSCTQKKIETAKTNVVVDSPEKKSAVDQPKKTSPLIQKSEIPLPQMPQELPKWDDIKAPDNVYQPVAGLALSHDYALCFKEWFQGDSLPPHIRKFQGRILNKEEKTIGQMIQCPEERKQALINSLRNP